MGSMFILNGLHQILLELKLSCNTILLSVVF